MEKLTKKELQERIGMLEKESEEKAKLAEERLSQLRYLQADFDNYRKRFEKEKEDIIRLADESLISELLAVLDDLDAALQATENTKDKEGIILVQRKFFKILEDHGLKQIDTEGKKFDPYFHEALLREACGKEDGMILEEFQKGYALKSKVIRTAKVKIAEEAKTAKYEEGEKNG
ncbi:MAG: nucleotide exchange factor GrpE [Candidatus Aenigmarchaeota archaeon]|nr:nucleotide exchange factor GrpE [Candidatus Aenigmarchaeota archaeon]MDI6722512.1 nucleotide exchange factor GrpE [Candidatus Aenigmarchaeota archaeon]